MNSFIDLIKSSKKIAIFSHINPDADALCSSIALKKIIDNNFDDKFIDVFTDGEIGKLYAPILRNDVINPKPFSSYDLAIVLDCPNIARIGKYQEMYKTIEKSVNIDHHGTNERFALVNCASPKVSSTCEMIYLLAHSLKLELNKDIAKLLYQGILTDTNCFTSNTMTAKTHFVLNELLSYKFNSNLIKEYYFSNQSLDKTMLEAKTLKNIKLYKNNSIALMKITNNDLTKNNVSFDDTMGIVDKGLSIEGVMICIVLIEKEPNVIHASIRGKGTEVDVSTLAKEFGGGGSPTVAAFQYKGDMKELEQSILSYIKEEADELNLDPDEKQLF